MIKYILKAISQGLAFSKTEAKGTLVLILLIIFVWSLSGIAISWLKGNNEISSHDSEELKKWVTEIQTSYAKKARQEPNTFDEPTFSQKETFKKERIVYKEKRIEGKKKVVLEDINTVSAEALRRVRGIGKVYSERIIKYRNLLGGFSQMDQLNEVYGLNSDIVEKMRHHFSVQSKVQLLPINSDSVKVLVKHPYISYDLAWVVINYRKQNGDIDDVNDLSEIKAIDDSLIQKLRPYLE